MKRGTTYYVYFPWKYLSEDLTGIAVPRGAKPLSPVHDAFLEDILNLLLKFLHIARVCRLI